MRKQSSNNPCQADPWASSTYQTGSTTPPKSHTGLIALLLVLVIVLCGIVTVLGITNVQLFKMLSGQEDSALPISFSNARQSTALGGSATPMLVSDDGVSLTHPLGIQGENVPDMYQRYYRLPCGLYVKQVEAASSSARRGIHPGDIITHMDGICITGPQDFLDAVSRYQAGDTVTLTVFRNSSSFAVTILVEPWR